MVVFLRELWGIEGFVWTVFPKVLQNQVFEALDKKHMAAMMRWQEENKDSFVLPV